MGNSRFDSDPGLLEQYLTWTAETIETMKTLIACLDDDGADPSEELEKVYGLAHNVKGMGANFDYILMTEIGASLCAYIKRLDDKDAYDAKVLGGHIRAFEVVIDNKITGTGGEKGTALIARLHAMAGTHD